MNKKTNIFFIIITIAICLVAFYAFRLDKIDTEKKFENVEFEPSNKVYYSNDTQIVSGDEDKESYGGKGENMEEKQTEEKSGEIIISGVPFVSQAPTGNWKDPLFQNGCEEAAAMMAISWAAGKEITNLTEAENEIRKISALEEKKVGSAVDASVEDVVSFIKEYFGYQGVEDKYDIGFQDIITELKNGKVVIVPTFGRNLGNPHYTTPGPITHMLVITGYDYEKKEFLTNDPGTKYGKGYRYNKDVLMDAIWNYPTGKEHPNPPVGEKRKTAMIIISPDGGK